MALNKTVVFADLKGSVGLYEELGNEVATLTVTRLTQWICQQCEANGGQVAKLLGDGVLALFDHPNHAIDAVVSIQREHHRRLGAQGIEQQLGIKVGLCSGELVESAGDWYGDSVNVASRLADMADAAQILASDDVVGFIDAPIGTRFRSLGMVPIRGRQEPIEVHRVEWDDEVHSEYLTMPATLKQMNAIRQPPSGSIELAWSHKTNRFAAIHMPIHLGRASDADFEVPHPRVSRLHARLNWRDGVFVLIDISSYGTWVRFEGMGTEMQLRRQECTLSGRGEMALGAPFAEVDVPVVQFDIGKPAET